MEFDGLMEMVWGKTEVWELMYDLVYYRGNIIVYQVAMPCLDKCISTPFLKSGLLLSTVHKHPLLKRLEALLSRLTSLSTEHQLCPQLPVNGNIPVLLRLAVNDGVVVLEIGTKAFSLESNPQSVLVHGGCVLGPGREVVCVDGKSLLKLANRGGVFEEEDLRDCVSVGFKLGGFST